MNLENYLYLAVVAFGLIQSVIASGVFMVVTGIALGGTGLALLGLANILSGLSVGPDSGGREGYPLMKKVSSMRKHESWFLMWWLWT